MSEAFDKVLARLDKLEKGLVEASRERYPKQSRRADDTLGMAIDRAATGWIACPIGTIESTKTMTATALLTLTTYATGGIALIPLGLPDVPGRITVTAPPFRVGVPNWTFKWDESTDTMLMHNSAGTELGAGLDVSAVSDWPFTVYGADPSDRAFFRAPGSCRVAAIALEVEEAVAQDAGDYWTLEVRRRAADDPLGETIGRIHRTSVFRIDAQTDLSLYPESTPTRAFNLAENDRLFLRAVATGVPQPLVGLTAWVLLQRRAR